MQLFDLIDVFKIVYTNLYTLSTVYTKRKPLIERGERAGVSLQSYQQGNKQEKIFSCW